MRVLFVIALTFVVALASEAQLASESDDRAEPTRTPGGEPSGQLDDAPILADEATTSNVDQLNQEAELCSRCYDSVKQASDLVSLYENLLKKQKRLIKRKKAAADAANASASGSRSIEDGPESAPRSPKNPRSAPATTTTSSPKANSTNLRVRMLEPGEIVVARLRVARSPATGYSKSAACKDSELEKLKREQQAKKEVLCNALQKAHDCLVPIGRQCLGDLNFHTNELFVDQSFQQYRCPFPNSNIKPVNIKPPFTRTLEEQVPVPQPRPISAESEVRERLDQMLPKWSPFRRPTPRLGVVLTPTTPRLARHQQSKPVMSWVPVGLACGFVLLLLMFAWQASK